jgi:hypothetical protein
MNRWFQATCVVKLGATTSIKDGTGENGAVTGYAINIGLCGHDLMQAMIEAERIALAKFEGARDGNRLEEVNIKEVPLEKLRGQYQFEERDSKGDPLFRSALIYFDE